MFMSLQTLLSGTVSLTEAFRRRRTIRSSDHEPDPLRHSVRTVTIKMRMSRRSDQWST